MERASMVPDLEPGVATVDATWHVTAWSPSVARTTGRATDDVIGGELWDALPALHRRPFEDRLRSVLADGLPRTIVLPGRVREGDEPLIEIEISRVGDQLLLLMRAVSPAAPADEVPLATDPLAPVVSGIARRLEDPLATIAAFADSLREEARTPGVAERAAVIHAEATDAARIVHALLDYVRPDGPAPRAVELDEAVDRVLEGRRAALQAGRITVDVTFQPALPRPWVDPGMVERILLDAMLCAEQAIAATGAPGRIEIAARGCDKRVLLTLQHDGQVASTGELERICAPGRHGAAPVPSLAATFGLVRGSGGRMWLQRRAEGGARISWELPTGPATPPPPSRPREVLIVDDHALRRRATQLRAERLGHRVEVASGRREGLERLGRAGMTFGAVLVDVDLGGAQAGIDLHARLVEERPELARRVIFTTGDTLLSATAARLDTTDRPILLVPCGIGELRMLLDRLPSGPE